MIEAEIKRSGIVWGKDLPDNLIVKDGKIVHKADGEEVTFHGLEGMVVNVVPRGAFSKFIDEWQTGRNWAS